MFVADVLRPLRHYAPVLDSKGLIAELQRLKALKDIRRTAAGAKQSAK